MGFMVDPVMEMKKSRKQKAETQSRHLTAKRKPKTPEERQRFNTTTGSGQAPDAEINCGQL